MKIPAIKKLVETANLSELKTAEAALLEELTPAIEVGGEDEGEQLTHVLAAIYILEEVEAKQIDVKVALRDYIGRVRSSIT
ncbi:MAG: hypothetical protein ACFB10_05720 [Salibacteraceae bacterium]